MNILIAGDSLGLPRPQRINDFSLTTKEELAVSYQETYGALLQQNLHNQYQREFNVINRCQRFFTMKQIASQFVDHLFFWEPEILILQVGVVDCWFRDELQGKQLVNLKEFEGLYKRVIGITKQRPESKLIIVGICQTSMKMENRYRGILKEIKKYNEVLKSSVDNNQIFYIDMEKHIDPKNPQVYLLPDDHHLNREGNKLLADKLTVLIQAIVENQEGCNKYRTAEEAPQNIEQALEHYLASFKMFPHYLDNLYNLLYLSIQIGKEECINEVLQFLSENNVTDPGILELIQFLYTEDK